eukprot:TRINITY_DN34853_c0_g1_i2.p2 TRINITY_DN34853_c0_g1~~TRINITY_DN34853_c0_g1_i2.p2  ORF type:complete len:152 (+),score=11.21 TRINITY_DN34853_c0_g1_i2:542-997(+)
MKFLAVMKVRNRGKKNKLQLLQFPKKGNVASYKNLSLSQYTNIPIKIASYSALNANIKRLDSIKKADIYYKTENLPYHIEKVRRPHVPLPQKTPQLRLFHNNTLSNLGSVSISPVFRRRKVVKSALHLGSKIIDKKVLDSLALGRNYGNKL